MLVFFTIFSFILFARASSFLFGYELLNIDESQMIANAIRRLQLNGFNIFEFDGTSSSFLNSLILIAKFTRFRYHFFKHKTYCFNFDFFNIIFLFLVFKI